MKMHISAWVILISAVLGLAACSSSAQTVRLTQTGQKAEIEAGEVFEVVLEGNPTTGYSWEAQDLGTSLLVQQGETEFKADSSAVGSGGRETLRFKALAAGTTTLKLVYHRSWEKDVPPLQSFEANITIR